MELIDPDPTIADLVTAVKFNKRGANTTLCQRIFPSGFKQELKSLFQIFLPCVLTGLFRFLNPLISLIMCGHLNRLKFDAAALAISLINILGVSIDLGFSTAFDTLFAQIYGSNQKKKMGSVLQRATVIMTLLYLVLACFHINIEPILILFKQDPEVSELAAKYILIYLPGLFFDFQFLTLSRYLQSQDIVYPMMVSSFIGDVFSAVSQYVAIYVYGYDIEASALLQGVACFVMFAIQLGYVLVSKVYKESWDGFSLRAIFTNWKIILLLGLPGILMVALETWNYEVATIIAGTLNQVQLGAQSVAFQCSTIAYMITLGLQIAITIRIGQYLGSQEIDKIKTCLNTAIVVGACTSLTSFTIIISLRNYLAKLFSNDIEIQNEAATLLILIAIIQFLDVVAGIGAGVLKSCGRQTMGAMIMFMCYYICGVPLGIVLVFVAGIEIKGMWIGLMTALFIEGVIFAVIISRTDWERQCSKAENNVENVYVDSDDDNSFSEESQLIVKSDFERSTHWATETHPDKSASFRQRRKIRTISFNENHTVTANRRKTTFLITSGTYHIEAEEPLKKVLVSRILVIVIVVLLFISAVLVRIYLPKSAYFPATNHTILPDDNATRIINNFPVFLT